jgi:hypothetical protein
MKYIYKSIAGNLKLTHIKSELRVVKNMNTKKREKKEKMY